MLRARLVIARQPPDTWFMVGGAGPSKNDFTVEIRLQTMYPEKLSGTIALKASCLFSVCLRVRVCVCVFAL